MKLNFKKHILEKYNMVLPLIWIAGVAVVSLFTLSSCSRSDEDRKRKEFRDALENKPSEPQTPKVTENKPAPQKFPAAPFLITDVDKNNLINAVDFIDTEKSTKQNLALRYTPGKAKDIGKYYVDDVYLGGNHEKIMMLGEYHYSGSEPVFHAIAKRFQEKNILTTFAFEHDKTHFAQFEKLINSTKPTDVSKNSAVLEEAFVQGLANKNRTTLSNMKNTYYSQNPLWTAYREHTKLLLDIRAMGHNIACVDASHGLEDMDPTDPNRIQLRDNGISQNISAVRAQMDTSKQKDFPLVSCGGIAHAIYEPSAGYNGISAIQQLVQIYGNSNISSHVLMPAYNDVMNKAAQDNQTAIQMLNDWMPAPKMGENPNAHDGIMAYIWK